MSAVTSASWPPMIPARAWGRRSASQMSRSSRSRTRVDAVEGGHGLAGLGAADDDAGTGEAVEVEGVERLVAFEEHVVGDVDDVADGTEAGLREPLREPGR